MAYQTRNEKNGWALFLLILAGIVLGGFIGHLASNVSFLQWLNFGYTFGMINNPLIIDLKVIVLTFQLVFNITVSSIVGVILAIFIYRAI